MGGRESIYSCAKAVDQRIIGLVDRPLLAAKRESLYRICPVCENFVIRADQVLRCFFFFLYVVIYILSLKLVFFFYYIMVK